MATALDSDVAAWLGDSLAAADDAVELSVSTKSEY
jgi:hypothetical protein